MIRPKPIHELIPGVLRQAAAGRELLERLQREWASFVSKAIAAHTKPVALRRRILYLHADEPGTHFALNLERTELLARLRQAGYDIEELVVRPGPS